MKGKFKLVCGKNDQTNWIEPESWIVCNKEWSNELFLNPSLEFWFKSYLIVVGPVVIGWGSGPVVIRVVVYWVIIAL